MTIQKVPYTECAGCKKPIYAGHAAVTFCRSIEQLENTAKYPGSAITVIDSQQLITLCAACGNKFSVERATEVLKAALNQPQFVHN